MKVLNENIDAYQKVRIFTVDEDNDINGASSEYTFLTIQNDVAYLGDEHGMDYEFDVTRQANEGCFLADTNTSY